MTPDPKSDDSGRREKTFPGVGSTLREVGPYLTLGLQLAAAVVGFFLLGWWLDGKEGTAPLFMLLGVLIGFVGGMIKFLKSVSRMSDKK